MSERTWELPPNPKCGNCGAHLNLGSPAIADWCGWCGRGWSVTSEALSATRAEAEALRFQLQRATEEKDHLGELLSQASDVRDDLASQLQRALSALKHARYRNHAFSSSCDGCLELTAALSSPPPPTDKRTELLSEWRALGDMGTGGLVSASPPPPGMGEATCKHENVLEWASPGPAEQARGARPTPLPRTGEESVIGCKPGCGCPWHTACGACGHGLWVHLELNAQSPCQAVGCTCAGCAPSEPSRGGGR